MMCGSFRFSRTAIFLAVLAMASSSAYGQGREPSGSLSGVVVDTAGRFMPNVNVSVKNNTTGTTSRMVTTSQGRFTMSGLDAGIYTVTCSLQDFKPIVLADLRVMAATPTSVRAVLVETEARSDQPPPPPPKPAQAPRATVAPEPPQPPKPATTPRPGTAPEAAPALAQARFSSTNVRVEVTIIDQTGAGAPTKKTVSLTVSDGGRGSVRSGVTVPIPSMIIDSEGTKKPSTSFSYRDMGLSLDVSRTMVMENYVRLNLAVEYNPVDEKMASSEGPTASMITQGVASFARFSQTLDLVLESGKPLVVASSSDPVPSRNRTASLEVKATILK